MKRVLLEWFFCVVEGILYFAQMIKELQQKLKQKFSNLFQPKKV